MCGVFTAQASWAEVVDFSQPLTAKPDDKRMRYRVGMNLPVVVFDKNRSKRIVVPMQWGWPYPHGRRGFQHIHCRSETIDQLETWKPIFESGQRGVVFVDTFNEGIDLPNGKTEQHTIDIHDDAPFGFAVLWKRFETAAGPLLGCVQVTVPANDLVQSLSVENDRMPAFLEHADLPVWLGEVVADPAKVKALLKTRHGVRWTMNKEQKAEQAKKDQRKPTVSDPTPGLF